MTIPDQLTQAATIAKEKGASQFTPRQLLSWYGYSKRGSSIVSIIRKDPRHPDFG